MIIMAVTLPPNIRRISRLRFDALAGYSRQPSAEFFSHELDWFEHETSPMLGALIRDLHDQDFGGIIMGRDEGGRFRCVEVIGWYAKSETAAIKLLDGLDDWSRRPAEDRRQRGRQHPQLDIFTPVVKPADMNEAFARLASTETFSPARDLIVAMIHYYNDIDGNFVEQFQSAGFDARFWELYLFALLTEAGFVFDRTYAAPDFLCRGIIQEIFVEAVTVNPSRRGNVVTEPLVPTERTELVEYFRQYMPIKWGSALTSKLHKEYGRLPHVEGKPIVLAVQDFHVPRSMTFTHSTLVPYLYGLEFSACYDAGGILHVNTQRISEHRWRDKRIESGFFYLESAEMISAVIQNPTATISKFNRIGALAGLGSKAVRMLKFGNAYNPEPHAAMPLPYEQDVNHPDYRESWSEGLNVYHNPRARHPLNPLLFPDGMHHRLEDGQIVHNIPTFHPFTAETVIIGPTDSLARRS